MTDTIGRVEVITGVERRRRWSVEDKLRIVAESLRPGASALSVARRHGLNPNQIYTWRRLAREGGFGGPPVEAAGFLPVHLVPEGVGTTSATSPAVRSPAGRRSAAEIELPNGFRLRVDAGLEGAALQRLVSTLLAVG